MFFFKDLKRIMKRASHGHETCKRSDPSHRVTFPRIVHSKTNLLFTCNEPIDNGTHCTFKEVTLLLRNCVSVNILAIDQLVRRLSDHGVKYICVRGYSESSYAMIVEAAKDFDLTVVKHVSTY